MSWQTLFIPTILFKVDADEYNIHEYMISTSILIS